MLTSVKYQFAEAKKPLIIYYAIIFTLVAIAYISANVFFSVHVNNISFSGVEMASMIFIFVAGLNSFKETFRMFMQNGVSRKTLFLSYLLSLLPVCGIMAVIDNSLGILDRYTSNYRSVFLQFYGSWFGDNPGIIQTYAVGLLWGLTTYAACAMAGYLITVLYYRMNKALKLLVSIGVPVFLIIVLPAVDVTFTGGAISKGIAQLIQLAIGARHGNSPVIAIGFNLLLTALYGALSFLLIRKAVVKEQV